MSSTLACGYALVGRGTSNIPAEVREVYVRPLENRTQRTQVEQALTRAIADEMVTRNRFSVVGAAEGAPGPPSLGGRGRLCQRAIGYVRAANSPSVD